MSPILNATLIIIVAFIPMFSFQGWKADVILNFIHYFPVASRIIAVSLTRYSLHFFLRAENASE
jgi:Cu/Ag efflux pump CusA